MNRHPTDVLSLLAGLLFLSVAVAAWTDTLTWRALDAERLWPVVLIGAGLALLAGATREGRRRGGGARPDDAGWEPADEDG